MPGPVFMVSMEDTTATPRPQATAPPFEDAEVHRGSTPKRGNRRRLAGRAGRHRPVCWLELATRQIHEDAPRSAQLAAALGTSPAGAHHEPPRAPAGHPLAGWRPGEAIDRPLTHEELAIIKTPCAAPAAAPGGSASKRRKVHVDPIDRDWFLDMLGHAAVLVRGPALVPRDVRRDQPEHSLSLEAERATSSAAWQEKNAVARRHDAAQRAHHEGDRRPVLGRGHDPRLGARMARRRGARRASLLFLGDESLAWHALELQEARQVLEGAPQP